MDEEMLSLVFEETEEKMQKTMQHTLEEFSSIRTGRANSAFVEKLMVDYYGTAVQLRQIASFSVPEAQQLVITPYDKAAIPAVEKAIQQASLGVNPSSDGTNVRLNFPPLTEERRKELVKFIRNIAEQSKVSVRNNRRTTRTELEQMKKDGDLSEDETGRYEKQLDQLTQNYEEKIQVALDSKEQELLAQE